MTPEDQMKSWLDMQFRAVTLVGCKNLRDENALMVSKWPAYRFMTPLAATKLFAAEYEEAYRKCRRANYDFEQYDSSTIGKKICFDRPSSQVTQMWNARKFADAFGLPYPIYLEHCFKFAVGRKRKQLPQPNQLAGAKGIARDTWTRMLTELWNRDYWLHASARMDFMPQYQFSERRNLPAQEVFLEQLLDHMEDAGSRETFVENYLISRQYLDAGDLLSKLPEEAVSKVIDEARRSCALWGQPSLPVEPFNLHQACFGLPGVVDTTGVICAGCSARALCLAIRQSVETQLLSLEGSVDPIAARKAAANRENVRKCRAKKKAEALSKV